jgi:hypothetical protein
MPKKSLNHFILCEHILSNMVSFSIFVLLAAAQAEHPDTSCWLQKPSEPKPQLLGVESGQARSQKWAKQIMARQ